MAGQPMDSPEARALREVAAEIHALREAIRPSPAFGIDMEKMMEKVTGRTPAEQRERGRVEREQQRAETEEEQAKLYKLVVIFAAVSALASLASVAVAVINA